MAAISSKDTKPEIIVRKQLFARGYRYRKNVKSLPGKPDIVLKKYKTIVLINGCFWHGHKNCKAAKLPDTNTLFWKTKITSNEIRDKRNISALIKAGWTVIVVWQCQILTKAKLENAIQRILRKLNSISFLTTSQ
jgi:DNA mismatch endonuclease, patch repair protein